MSQHIKTVAALAAGAVAGFMAGRMSVAPDVRPGSVHVLTRTDTVRVERPVAVIHTVLDTITERLVEHTTRDTVYVEVPRTQSVYEGADYRAYVSGFRASLDSISVYRRHSYCPQAAFQHRLAGRLRLYPQGISALYRHRSECQPLEFLELRNINFYCKIY